MAGNWPWQVTMSWLLVQVNPLALTTGGSALKTAGAKRMRDSVSSPRSLEVMGFPLFFTLFGYRRDVGCCVFGSIHGNGIVEKRFHRFHVVIVSNVAWAVGKGLGGLGLVFGKLDLSIRRLGDIMHVCDLVQGIKRQIRDGHGLPGTAATRQAAEPVT